MAKKITELGALLRWRGELMEVVSWTDGRVIYMTPVGAERCKHCGELKEVAVVEASPLFQENAEPVETLHV